MSPGPPSYEELAALVVELSARLAEADARIAELEAQLGKNSSNSSKPPSSDGLVKPSPKSLRGRSGRRPGGQAGHRGQTLCQVADPDRRRRHVPARCRGCGAGLAGAAEAGSERRQVFDIPPIKVRVTGHELVRRRCGCVTTADAPEGVDAPVQYGPNVAAIVVYLYVGQFLSKDRTAKALAELFGTALSAGTVAAMTARAAAGLAAGGGFAERVRDRLTQAQVAHFDETALRVDRRLRWVHSASTGKYVLITVHDRRGVEAMDAAGVLPRFNGIAVHDGWAPYDTCDQATHARCNAHVLRELQAVLDHHERTGHAGTWCWAAQAADALRTMKRLVDASLARDGTLNGVDETKMTTAKHAFRSAARLGIKATAARADNLEKDHNALARRLLEHHDDHLRFTVDARVPFDNNAAEREIRMIKIRQKVSGCLRTLAGAQQFCLIRSYPATTAKQGLGLLDALTRLTNRRPWVPSAA
ncbi:IS66 family transposase [Actinomadura sp. K4S16]|uniref:IS66 family transposase n=1 Tax=Actinomadura sp. K4S16 TaxID=1316147 RepID=UPI0011EFC9D2|nr:IS66 family transposase [Actinomadura sp. K4S16]